MPEIDQVRRLVTILFTDLSNSTGIAAGLEPEQYADLLEQLRAVTERVIPAHGGSVIRLDGDGVLAVFGYPEPFEDAGRRATEAALDLHAAMTSLDAAFAAPDQPLRLHSGIHAGLVLVRSGDVVRGKYEILGDATNTAARICDAALPGEILVSGETLGSDRQFFVTGPAQAVAVAGHRAKVPAWTVTGRADTPNRFSARTRQGLTRYAGRIAEKGAFLDWLDDPGQTPRVLKVHGPPGIGKSRFASEAADLAKTRGWDIVRGYCEAYLSAQPLQPFRHVIGALLGPLPAAAMPATDYAATIGRVAAARSLLLILDDWQWADDASRDLLAELAALPNNLELKIMLLTREAESELVLAGEAQALPLPPLGRDEALTTIEQLLHIPDPFVIDRIKQAAGGSPLLIEELCHAFAGEAAMLTADPRGAWFDLAVQARFAKLGASEAALLRTAAVIGHFIPAWLLGAAASVAAEPAALEALQAADFLFPGDTTETLRFKHGLTRDAIYAGIGLADRKRLHRCVLEALEARAAAQGKAGVLDALAYHSAAANLPAKALPYGIEAGDAALASGALDRAQGHYLACFDLVAAMPDGPAKRDWAWALLNKYGLACIVDPAPDQLIVLDRMRALLDRLGTAHDQLRSAYWLGLVTYGIGLGKNSVQHLQAARAIAESGGTQRDKDLIRIKLAHSLFASGRYAEAEVLFERQLPQLGTAHGRNDLEIAAYAHACYGFMQSDQGDFARAGQLFSQSEVILADPDNAMNASILLYRAAALVLQGEWDRAIAETEAVLSVSQRSRTRMQSRTCRAQAAFARWQLARDLDAVTALERAASLFLAPGVSRQRASMVFGWVVQVMAETHDKAKARRYMGGLIKCIRTGGDRLGEALAWRALARLAQAEGDSARADRYLRFARHSAAVRQSRREIAQNQLCEGELLLARGHAALAKRLLAQAADEFAAMGMPFFRDRAASLPSR